MTAELEIQISPEAGFAAANGKNIATAREAFDTLGTVLTEAIAPFKQKFSSVLGAADEVELNLSLALKGEGKWVVVSLSAEATASIKVTWKKNEDSHV